MAGSKASRIAEINTLIADNVSGDISPEDERTVLLGLVDDTIFSEEPNAQQATGSVSLAVKQVGVNDASHLPLPSGGIITLADDIRYLIGNDIDLGTDRIVMGSDTVFEGIDENIVTVTYTGTGVMFSGVDVTFRLKKFCAICTSGTFIDASDVSSPTSSFVILDNVDIASANILGTIDSVRVFAMFRCAFGSIVTGGFLFVGALEDAISHFVLANISNGIFLDFASATFDSVDIDSSNIVVSSGATAISGLASSANINSGGLGKVRFCRFSGVGAILSGLTVNDGLWNFTGNDDIADTMPDGLLSMTDNSTETMISSVAVGVLAGGIWDNLGTSQFIGTSGGRLTYTGGRPVRLLVTASITATVSSGTNLEIHFHLYLNGSIIETSKTEASIDAGDVKNQDVEYQITFQPGDFLELFVENNTNTTNVTLIDAKLRVN